MSEETEHSISPEPGHTCPKIDDVIDKIKEALHKLKGYNKMELDELKSSVSDAEWCLDSLMGRKGELEAIRDHVISIRSWGKEWKDKALEYHCQIPEADECGMTN